MWAVVDYNTMSDESTVEAAGNGNAPIGIWPDSMTELFGAIDYQLVTAAAGFGDGADPG